MNRSDSKEYSPNDAAEKLIGWTGKRRGDKLRNLIQKKEKRLGVTIARRFKYRNGTNAMMVTERALRTFLPELFDASITSIVREVRSKLESIDALIDSSVASHVQSALKNGQRHASVILAETRRVEETLMFEIGRLSRRIGAIEDSCKKTKHTGSALENSKL